MNTDENSENAQEDVELLCFSANLRDDLIRRVQEWQLPENWQALREECARSRREFAATHLNRLVITVDRKKADMTSLLDRAKASLSGSQAESGSTPDGIFWGSGSPLGKLALLFPGQGSQYVGMLAGLKNSFPGMDDAIAAADGVFKSFKHKCSLSSLLFDPAKDDADEERLTDTQVAQPAIGAVSLGLFNLLKRFSLPVDMVGGHSYGELTALCAAGSINEDTFFQMSNLRGQLMAKEGVGSMLALRSSAEDSSELIRKNKLNLVIANHNAPNQTVLSGPVEEIQRCWELLRAQNIPGKVLDVSAAFHSAWVAHAQKPFSDALKRFSFSCPKLPVYANVTADTYPSSAAEVRELLVEQIAKPVRFVEQIRNMFKDGARTFLQVGPSNQLANLISSILQGEEHEAIAIDASKGSRSNHVDLARSLAKVAVLGHEVALAEWDTTPLAPVELLQPKLSGACAPLPLPRLPSPITKADDIVAPSEQRPEFDPNLAAALQQTQRNIQSIQATQTRVAELHQQFLEDQRQAQQNLQALIQQQQCLANGDVLTTGILPTIAPQRPPRACAPAAPAPRASAPAAPAPPPSPVAAASPVAEDANQHHEQTLLAIVAETTGYPTDMLNVDMSLDADLGIDSIKRVEILSALEEELPNVPPIPTEQLGTIHTLADILSAIAAAGPASEASAPKAPAPETSAPEPPAADGASEALAAAVLEVVHETTGYPVEMLDMSMDLNADLGIDSIKRMEIFSAITERFPDSPEIPTEKLGSIQTLDDIVLVLNVADSASTSAASTDAAPKTFALAAEPTTRSGSIDLPAGATIWVSSDGAVDKALVAELKAREFSPILVDLNSPPAKIPADLQALVLLSPLGALSDSFLQAAFALLQRAESTLCRDDAGTILLAAVSRLDGAFGLQSLNCGNSESVSGGLAGLIKSARFEWPSVTCKAIDLDAAYAPDDLATQIADELLSDSPIEVGLSQSGRVALQLSDSSALPALDASLLKAGDVVVVSGGARGVTADTALALAGAWQPTLLLLGRSPLPEPEAASLQGLETDAELKQAILDEAGGSLKPRELEKRFSAVVRAREIHGNIAAIEAAGSTVLYRSVDVRDAGAVKTIIDQTRKEAGPIRGLLHGAGVLADRRIADKTAEQFASVYSTKVAGLFNLLDALADDDLRIMAIFSSMTGRFGRVGQIDYAAANEVINKTAQSQARSRPSCTVRAFNWGPWEGGMVTEGLKKQFAAEGISVIPRKTGADFMARELCAAPGQAVELVVLGGDSTLALQDHA
ncbi:MAG: malonyl CoA-acyl carrier protein transacylase [Rhodothermales bacterium]|jgi:malonyl CoA-acyl carrier protein transacylase/NAD(P)-dependent dehydrogenase (short-subunit alcohol dehydrogenase family)